MSQVGENLVGVDTVLAMSGVGGRSAVGGGRWGGCGKRSETLGNHGNLVGV